MIEEAPKDKGGNPPGVNRKEKPYRGQLHPGTPPNLASQGIDKNLAKRARTLARG